MPIPILMPQLGELVLEGVIAKWLVATGEVVKEFDPLIEINTDKVNAEIPSPASGILLQIVVREGATAHAGDVLGWIDPGAMPDSSAEIPGRTQPTSTPDGQHDLGTISPVVARLAREEGIDLRQVEGSGKEGRITKQDVLNYIAARAISPGQSKEALSQDKKRTAAPTASSLLMPITDVRRAIAEHTTSSSTIIPHVTIVMEADLSNVIAHRLVHKEIFAGAGVNLTFTAYFVAAASAALKAYPMVNSSWSKEGILLHQAIHIGIATSLDEKSTVNQDGAISQGLRESGLIVPVIRHADHLSLLELARAINDLTGRARTRQLLPDEVKGSTFTITNPGPGGALFGTPIIPLSQCGILSVGRVQKRPVVVSDPAQGELIAIRPMAYLGLTFDHRILDGVMADGFLSKVVESLESS